MRKPFLFFIFVFLFLFMLPSPAKADLQEQNGEFRDEETNLKWSATFYFDKDNPDSCHCTITGVSYINVSADWGSEIVFPTELRYTFTVIDENGTQVYQERFSVTKIDLAVDQRTFVSKFTDILIPASVTDITASSFSGLSSLNHNMIIHYSESETNLGLSHIAGSPGLMIERSSNSYLGWVAGTSVDSALYFEMNNASMTIKSKGDQVPSLPAMSTFVFSDFPVSSISELRLTDSISSLPEKFAYTLPTGMTVKKIFLNTNIKSQIPQNALIPGVEFIEFDGYDYDWKEIYPYTPALGPDKISYKCKVTFRPDTLVGCSWADPSTPVTEDVMYNDTVSSPQESPIPKDGYGFTGKWYTEQACTFEWNFNSKVTSSMDLFAGYELLSTNPISLNIVPTSTVSGNWARLRDKKGEPLSSTPYVGQPVTVYIHIAAGYDYNISIRKADGADIPFNDVEVAASDEACKKFDMPDAEVIVTVTYQLKQYNISLEESSDGTITSTAEKSEMDKEITISATPNGQNMAFSEWSIKYIGRNNAPVEDIITENPYTFIMPASDVEIKASFVRKVHTINLDYDTQYGKITLDPGKNPDVGELIIVRFTPSDDKYFLKSFSYLDDKGDTVTVAGNSFIMPDYDITITPNILEKTTYTVVWLNGDGSQLETATYDNTQDMPTPKQTPTKKPSGKYAFVFSGWKEGVQSGTTITFEPEFEAVERKELYIVWLNGDGTELDRSKAYYEGDKEPTTQKVPEKAGEGEYRYVFKRWDDGTIEGNTKTYTPIFTRETVPYFVITVNPNNVAYGAVAASEKSAPEGTKISLRVSPSPGYFFDRFDVQQGGIEINGNTFTVGKENISILAIFAKIRACSITFDAGGGTGSMPKQTENSGNDYTLPACGFTAPQGKVFFCWQVGDKTFQPGEKVPVKDDMTITAIWKDPSDSSSISYTVTFMIDNEYSVAVQTVIKGNKAVKPSDPVKDGYVFVGWYSDSSLTSPFNFDTSIESNWTLYAKWTPKAADTDETIEYTVIEGAAQKWTKNSTVSPEIRAQRNINDNTSLSHFVGVQIDGKSLVKDVDYTVRSGSVIVTLKPSALNNLANGIHRVTFVYDDGKAETTLTILESSEGDSKGSPSGGGSGGSSNPSTGDIFSNPVLWFGGMILVIFVLKLFINARKRRMAEAEAMMREKF